MARLPNPGSDNGTWGSILNSFLSQIHNADGSLKDNIVDTAHLQAGAVTNSKIATGTIAESKLDASVLIKLNASGGLVVSTDITDSTLTGRSLLTAASGAAARTVIGAGTVDTAADIGLGNVDNTSDATKNAAVATLTNKTISGASNTLSNIAQSSVTSLVSDLSGKANTSHSHVATDVSNSTATGRSLLTAADASAAKTVLSLSSADVGLGNVNNTSDLNKPISTATQTALDDKADLVGGVVPTAQLPALAYTDTVVVADETEMLALTTGQVQPGDIAVRTDGEGSFILTDTDPSVLANWTLLDSPANLVTSVNGQQGTVVLGGADVGLGNVNNTSDLNKPISTATQTALDDKADLVGGVVPSSQLPAISLNTVVTVADQAAMLALTTGQVQPGDIAVRADGAGSFILTDTDPSVLGNWTLLSSPDDTIQSVNGQTGVVVLGSSDIGLGNVDNTSDATKNAAAVTLTNKTINLANNSLTGTIAEFNTAISDGNIVALDGNNNFSADAFIKGTTSTATSAGTTTLTIDSTQVQIFTGSTTQTLRLPTTSVTLGMTYKVINQSTGVVTVESSGANNIHALSTNDIIEYTASTNTPTTAAHWYSHVLNGLRYNSVASSATPTINTDHTDHFAITALATDITSMTSGLSGTPRIGQQLMISITDNSTPRAITWGASFTDSGLATLPTTTVAGNVHWVGLVWDGTAWACLAADGVGY